MVIQEKATIFEIMGLSAVDVLKKFETSEHGLQSEEAKKRLQIYGHNELAKRKKKSAIASFFYYFKNPLIIILIVAAIVSELLGQIASSMIIIAIVLLSIIMNFVQEHRASKAAEKLRKRVATTATVVRDGRVQEIKVSELVPGDIIMLSAGDIVPADARVISTRYLFVDQSALTGESVPAYKKPEPVRIKQSALITEWSNYVFMGTSVISGTATAVIVKTGSSTEYGEIVKKTIERAPETEFEKELKSFSYFITQTIFFLVVFVFAFNALFKHSVLESLLFAIALAVGLTPDLLPMIISVNLSKGSIAMAKKGVVVKRLASIQNFGSMDVLCCDKTGTLTENKVKVKTCIDTTGRQSEKVFLYSFLNSSFQTGIKNTLDEAILAHKDIDISGYKKIDEIPFDFVRKRISVIVEKSRQKLLITKGAPESIFKVSSYYERNGKIIKLTKEAQKKIEKKNKELCLQGFRVIGVAYKKITSKEFYKISDESDMILVGFVAFLDPPKKTAKEAVGILEKSGIELKILTGDNEFVTKKICEELGIEVKKIITGAEIEGMNDYALSKTVEKANIFARVTPMQKNRIIEALKKNKHVVGFLGDGINDSPSLKISDVGISVDNATDIAKESADIILLHKDLKVLHEGVLEGRKTFGNTMKYMMMGLSSNFGNMISAAGASLFLPFLPMLPIQILLNNLLYDTSQLTIPSDNVDAEYIKTPKKMDISFVRRFMVYFGPLSSIFDFLTFFIMIYIFKASEHLFQTGWFVESLLTQTLIIFIIRTRKTPFFKSKPSKFLVYNILAIIAIALLMPFTPLKNLFNFVPLPISFLGILVLMVITYLTLVELLKRRFYRES